MNNRGCPNMPLMLGSHFSLLYTLVHRMPHIYTQWREGTNFPQSLAESQSKPRPRIHPSPSLPIKFTVTSNLHHKI